GEQRSATFSIVNEDDSSLVGLVRGPGLFFLTKKQTGEVENATMVAGLNDGFAFDAYVSLGFDTPLPKYSRLFDIDKEERTPIRMIPPDSFQVEQLLLIWDRILMNGLEEMVAAALRILESRVQSVHFITNGVIVGLKDQEQRVPLGSLGDGMRRMLTLAMNMAVTRGGYLFIDEIDTGLHYTTLPNMWKLVIEQANAANIQVFASTHSRDCLTALAELCEERPDLQEHVSVHTIDTRVPHSVRYSGEQVVRMERHGVDPR
ncbi:MAG: AAA family ATPase, partial [Gemmataceae bacterium]